MKFRFLCIFLSLLVININFTFAAKKAKATKILPERIQTSLILDSATGRVLHSENAKVQIFPASLTKVMTLYMLFEAIEARKLALHHELPVSKKAEQVAPGKLGLKAGEYIKVKDIINGIIVKSANDTTIVAAEALGRTEENFARAMTLKAKQLGMRDTVFMNSHGLHDHKQKTTAIDLAKLSLAIKRDFPKFYPLFAETNFTFRGKVIRGHNRVTENYPGATGLKTGFTNPSGFNLITSASRNGKSLLGIVTGSPTSHKRDKKMMSLMDKHFDDKVTYAENKSKEPTSKKIISGNAKKSAKAVLVAKNKAPILLKVKTRTSTKKIGRPVTGSKLR